MARSGASQLKVLVIDVGGSHVKVRASGHEAVRKVDSGPTMTAAQMVAAAKSMALDWDYDVVSIGYPGAVHGDRPTAEPRNLGTGWVDFDFAKVFGCPVKMINDASMQALGSYDGGRMLFLGLGTGLGSALIADGVLAPLELAHLPYRKRKTFEDYVGARGRKRRGKKKWRKHVAAVCAILRSAMQAEYVVIGGGGVKRLHELPAGARRGDNANAFLGGFRMWQDLRPHVSAGAA
ncbi:MAG TPA: ROK family protein [Polyangiales bacterium]